MPFTIKHCVQFSETDMACVVHFANYFRMMEEVEHAFFRSLGLSVVMQFDGVELGWPRVSVACDYFGPAQFEDQLDLRLTVVRVGDKSLSYEVRVIKDDQAIALGKITAVCCAMVEGGFQAIAIPGVIAQKLKSGLEAAPGGAKSD